MQNPRGNYQKGRRCRFTPLDITTAVQHLLAYHLEKLTLVTGNARIQAYDAPTIAT